MVRYAKNSEKLYADMRSLYEDTDFPGWWYSPARNANGAPPSSTEIGAAPPSKTDVGAGNGELRAPDPTVDPSIGRRSQRPPLPLRSDPLRQAPPSCAELRPDPLRLRSRMQRLTCLRRAISIVHRIRELGPIERSSRRQDDARAQRGC